MGFGLGKNSPVVLSFGKANYEALIERHGQFVRWRIAVKCPCQDKHTQESDPRCPHCGGRGFRYSYQPHIVVTEDIQASDVSGIVEVSGEYADAALDVVYDFQGRKYPAEKRGRFVTLKEIPAKGTYLTAVMKTDTVKILKEAVCENAGGGYFRVNGLRYRKNGIEGIHYTAPADIVKIGAITDAAGVEYDATELRTDLFRIVPNKITGTDGEGNETEIPVAEPVTVKNVEYVPPFVFALTSQNLSKEDSEIMTKADGNAVLTFPYNCDVSEGDILTALSGTYTQKEKKR